MESRRYAMSKRPNQAQCSTGTAMNPNRTANGNFKTSLYVFNPLHTLLYVNYHCPYDKLKGS